MSKAAKYILITLAAIVIGTAFYYFVVKKDNNISQIPSGQSAQRVENKSNPKDQRISDVQTYEKSVSAFDIGGCDNISDVGLKDQCYSMISRSKSDETGCLKIQGAEEKQMCVYYIHKALAIKNKTIEPCLSLKPQYLSDRCIRQTKDAGFCQDESCLKK